MTSLTSQQPGVETYGFIYGDEHVPYRVERFVILEGKPKKMSIRVHPNSQVVVHAPDNATRTAIHNGIMQRAKWVYDRLQEFNKQQAYVQPRRYVSGEMQFYLGRRYVLKIINENDSASQVKLTRGQLQVWLKEGDKTDTSRIQKLLADWYKQRAHHMFSTRLKELLPRTPWVKSSPPYRLLSMEKQWGSCSASGLLILNPHLVKAPRSCIDYVILHELCHIREHNHGERFFRLLTRAMPEWRETKNQLDGMAEVFLNG